MTQDERDAGMSAGDESFENDAQRAKAAKNVEKIKKMGTEPMVRLVIRYSLPAIAGLIVTAFYVFVDGIFIGLGVGDAGIAATAVALPFIIVTMALNTLIGNGGNIVASIRLGEGKLDEAERALGNTVTLLVIAWIVIMAVFIPLVDQIVTISGATEDSFLYAKQYMIIMIVGFIASGLSGGVGNIIRTAGSPNIQMIIMIIGGCLNIVFDYFAVLVFRWEIIGAAGATVLSQIIASVLVMLFFTRKTSPLRYRLAYAKLDKRVSINIFKLGLAGFFMNALMAITTVVINQLYTHYGSLDPVGGTGALAAYGAAGRVQNLFFQIMIGISMAAQPIIGFNHGAALKRRVRSCFWVSANIGFAGLLVMTVICELVPIPLLTLFGMSEAVLGFSVFTLRSMMIMIPLAAYGIMASTYFMATNQPGKANILVLLRQLILLVPVLILCPIVLPMFFPISPVASIIWAYPIVDVVSTAISMAVAWKDLRRLGREISLAEATT
ncbi:MAG: MATE family efflux transporter [Coriobacteriales bacterium]